MENGSYRFVTPEMELAPGETLTDEPTELTPNYSQIIANRRYEAEIGGMKANGASIDTGRDSQALITGAALSAVIDPAYVCNWKTSEGFVQLDSPTLISIAQAIRKHVQACFDRESALLALVEKGRFKEYLLDKGWPVYE